MNLVNAELVAWVSGLTVAAVGIIKQAYPNEEGVSRERLWRALALGIAELLTLGACLIGVQVPEGANWFAWVGLHGFVGAVMALGGYDVGKLALGGKAPADAVKMLMIGLFAGALVSSQGCIQPVSPYDAAVRLGYTTARGAEASYKAVYRGYRTGLVSEGQLAKARQLYDQVAAAQQTYVALLAAAKAAGDLQLADAQRQAQILAAQAALQAPAGELNRLEVTLGATAHE